MIDFDSDFEVKCIGNCDECACESLDDCPFFRAIVKSIGSQENFCEKADGSGGLRGL